MTATVTAPDGATRCDHGRLTLADLRPRTDYCPMCVDTPDLRRAHGPTAGIDLHPRHSRWWCTRCDLEAIDYEDACSYAIVARQWDQAGVRWSRMVDDARNGRAVDPRRLARAMGRWYSPATDYGGYNPVEGPITVVSAIIEAICCRPPVAPGGSWPWSDLPAGEVAEMVLTALLASGVATVDALGDDALDHREPGHPTGDNEDWARWVGRSVAFAHRDTRRTGPATPTAVIAAVVGEIQARTERAGRTTVEAANQMISALAAAGYALVEAW